MKLKSIVRRLPLLPALPVVFIIRLLSPIILIRIGQINSGRIGHFSMDVELSILKRQNCKSNTIFPKIIDLYFMEDLPSNTYLLKLWNQKIAIYPKWILKPIHRINMKLPRESEFNVFNEISHRDLTLLDKFPPILKMSQEDEDESLSILKNFGITKEDKFVCLCVRDSEYLNRVFPGTDWSEHSHRDSNINSYVKAAEFLATEGYKVVRMGKIVSNKLESTCSSIIDYANSELRSDMLDIYLFSHAYFIITTSSGMDFLGALFRVPMGMINIVSPISIFQGELIKSFQVKEMVDLYTGQQLGLEELLTRGYSKAYNYSDFVRMNIKLIDNTPEDLTNFFSEMERLVKGDQAENFSPEVIAILERHRVLNNNWAKLSPTWLMNHSYYLSNQIS